MSSSNTAIVFVDVYNDFLEPKGALHSSVKEALDYCDAVKHIKQIYDHARSKNIPIYYALHRHFEEGDMDNWKYTTATNDAIKKFQSFKKDSFGGSILAGLEPDLKKGDIIAEGHMNISGFVGTNLDTQLRKHGMEKLIFAGMTANTCLESTARYAMELGYHTTMISDATGAWDLKGYKAAVEVAYPLFAHSVKTTDEWLKSV